MCVIANIAGETVDMEKCGTDRDDGFNEYVELRLPKGTYNSQYLNIPCPNSSQPHHYYSRTTQFTEHMRVRLRGFNCAELYFNNT